MFPFMPSKATNIGNNLEKIKKRRAHLKLSVAYQKV